MTPQKITRRVGLARALSKLGYCSRSQAAALARAGRVSLNGTIKRDPETPLVLEQARITVDGHAVDTREKIYLMMNKPRGAVTTASDEKGRSTVYDVLREAERSSSTPARKLPSWVSPVGRLDKASEGLLLLTNDSEWGARVAAPETHLEKTYRVQLAAIADEMLIESLIRGVKAEDGTPLRAKRAQLLRTGSKTCWLEIVLDEGKNRQIRRMMQAMNIEVLRLIRVAIGPLVLGHLVKGEVRPLTTNQKRALDCAIQGGTDE